MTNRLGGVLSARAIRHYRRVREQGRAARAEVRRLQQELRENRWESAREIEAIEQAAQDDREAIERELNAEIATLHQEIERARADYADGLEAMQEQIDDAVTLKAVQQERADNAEAEIQQLRAEIEIFKARDELWAQWETRERARLEAETARLAAAKVRALELPHYDQET